MVADAREWDPHDWEIRCRSLYACRVSRVYHKKRERFFDYCDGVTKVVALIGGAGSIARATSASPGWLVGIGVAVTVTSSLSLVIGYAKKSRTHADLAKSFIELELKILTAGVADHESVIAFQVATTGLEMNEPRSLGALVRICQNEVLAAEGKKDQMKKVSPFQRVFAHLYDFDLTSEDL